MSHNFDCVIDTSELAQEIHSVKQHVNATTTAVVGLQAAVIKAQADGAEHVCKKVNQGFYALIHSQISQKMAALHSKLDAQILRLNQQRKQLSAIRQRMERDYQMISARYLKIFNSLNRNLAQRITEVDRPVILFATTETDKIANRSNQMVATVPMGQAESVKTSQAVVSSNLKYRAAKAIESIDSFIADSKILKSITDRILLPRKMADPTLTLCVPVCIAESNIDGNGNMQTRIQVSEIGLTKDARQSVETRVGAAYHDGALVWKVQEKINPEVENYFNQLVAKSNLGERQRKMVVKMFGSSCFDTL